MIHENATVFHNDGQKCFQNSNNTLNIDKLMCN